MSDLNEEFYKQVSDSIKSIFDLTSRIDERVKMLVEKQSDVDDRFEKIMEHGSDLSRRLTILETASPKGEVADMLKQVRTLEIKVAALEMNHSTQENRWSTLADYGLKFIWTIGIAYLMYKLGLSK
jgi:hypothetical protein